MGSLIFEFLVSKYFQRRKPVSKNEYYATAKSFSVLILLNFPRQKYLCQIDQQDWVGVANDVDHLFLEVTKEDVFH